jgi:osmotically-inducible protein OsmY
VRPLLLGNTALTAAKGVASINMRWTATSGRVVLTGVARSQQETDIALRKIRCIAAVKTLKSDLRAVPKKN